MSLHISRISHVDKNWIPFAFTSLVINIKGIGPFSDFVYIHEQFLHGTGGRLNTSLGQDHLRPIKYFKSPAN